MTQPPDASGGPAEPARRLGQVAARGLAITMSGQGLRIIIQMGGIAVLARLLTPSDYGLVAMVTVVVGLAEIFRDFGLSSAVIRAPSLSKGQRDNLFWASAVLGLILSIITVLGAPLVAAFFHEPLLVPITQVIALVFLFNGMATQYRAGLSRDMRFKSLAGVDVLGQAVALAVGIAAALSGLGYWSLVAMQVTQSLAGLVLAARAARWFPGRLDRSAEMRSFFVFGWHMVGTQLLGYAGNNMDSLVIGRRLGQVQLGVYDRAYRMLMVPLNQVRAPTTTVALPVLAKLQDRPADFSAFLLRGQSGLGYTIVAGLALVAGASEPVVAVMLGPGWGESAPILSLLAIAGAMTTLSYVGYWVYLSRALTKQLLHYSFVSTAVKISLILLGSQWGVLGVAAGVAVHPALMWPVSIMWLSHLTEIPLRGLLIGASRLLLVAATSGLAAWAAVNRLSGLDPVLALIAAGIAWASVYAIAAVLAPPVRRDIVWVMVTLRKVLDRKRRGGAAKPSADGTTDD